MPAKGRGRTAILAYHAHVPASDDAALADVNRVWGDADVVLYSPKIDTGVSHDRPDRRFERVFVIGTRPSAQTASPFGVNRLLQQVSRARGVQEVHAWVDPSWRHYLPTESERIERGAEGQQHEQRLELHLAGAPLPRGPQVPENEGFEQLGHVVEPFRRLRSADVAADFFQYYSARRLAGRG